MLASCSTAGHLAEGGTVMFVKFLAPPIDQALAPLVLPCSSFLGKAHNQTLRAVSKADKPAESRNSWEPVWISQ